MNTYRTFSVSASYEKYEKQSKSAYNRICIDGKVTGCGNCVGYCQYDGHPGFLTLKQRVQHNCIEKGCFYYIPKPMRNVKKAKSSKQKSLVLATAKMLTEDLEGLKVVDVVGDNFEGWKIKYVTISNEYSILDLEQAMESIIESKISFVKLNFSFEQCAHLIFGQ